MRTQRDDDDDDHIRAITHALSTDGRHGKSRPSDVRRTTDQQPSQPARPAGPDSPLFPSCDAAVPRTTLMVSDERLPDDARRCER